MVEPATFLPRRPLCFTTDYNLSHSSSGLNQPNSIMFPSATLQKVGDKPGYAMTRTLREDAAQLLGRRSPQFPGSQPVTLCRKHFTTLMSRDYLVYEKTDGVRCLLYLAARSTAGPGGDTIYDLYLIDRKNEYYRVKDGMITLPAAMRTSNLRHDSLLDGELVLQRRSADGDDLSYAYVVFDCLAVDGQAVIGDSHEIRRRLLKTFMADVLQTDGEAEEAYYCPERASEELQLQLKRPLPAHRAKVMLRRIIPQLRHGNDGLVFVRRHGRYVIGTDDSTFKWKPPGENTVDFRLQVCHSSDDPNASSGQLAPQDRRHGPYRFQLQTHLGEGMYQNYADLHLGPEDIDAMYAAVGAATAGQAVLECFLDTCGRWRPKLEAGGSPRFRNDKMHGNHVSVLGEILQSIQDGVTEEALLSLTRPMRASWKSRRLSQAQFV